MTNIKGKAIVNMDAANESGALNGGALSPATKRVRREKPLRGIPSRSKGNAAFSWKVKSKTVRRFLSTLTGRPFAELEELLAVATNELNRITERREQRNKEGKIERVEVKARKAPKVGKILREKHSKPFSVCMRLLRKMNLEELVAAWKDMTEARAAGLERDNEKREKRRIELDAQNKRPFAPYQEFPETTRAKADAAVSRIVVVVKEFTTPMPKTIAEALGAAVKTAELDAARRVAGFDVSPPQSFQKEIVDQAFESKGEPR